MTEEENKEMELACKSLIKLLEEAEPFISLIEEKAQKRFSSYENTTVSLPYGDLQEKANDKLMKTKEEFYELRETEEEMKKLTVVLPMRYRDLEDREKQYKRFIKKEDKEEGERK